MNKEEKLKVKIGTETGFKVPDGYFDEVFSKIAASLPEQTIEKPKPLTKWQRMKPYVYMAAMFAGIWCMMKMFHSMTIQLGVSLENPPAVIAEAMSNNSFVEEYMTIDNLSGYEMETSLEGEYEDFDDFVADFDYQFEEDIEKLDIQSFID